MKKLFALTLAVAMVLSLASVAFAATDYHFTVDLKLRNDDFVAIGPDVEFDNDFYYAITDDDKGGAALKDSDGAKKIKVKTTWDNGADYVDSVSVVKAMNSGVGEYVVRVTLKEQPTKTGSVDILGTITLSGSSVTFAGAKEVKIPVAMTACNPYAAKEELDDDVQIFKFAETAGTGVIAWDEETELELYAGMGRFVVNTIGQGKVVVANNVKYNAGIEGVAADVNYVYFNGNGATFNKIGTLYLDGKEDNLVYKVNADGTLTKLEAKYDDVEEAFAIRTRVLGSYVIAEQELNLDTVNTAVKPAPEAPVAPDATTNPSTGAAC